MLIRLQSQVGLCKFLASNWFFSTRNHTYRVVNLLLHSTHRVQSTLNDFNETKRYTETGTSVCFSIWLADSSNTNTTHTFILTIDFCCYYVNLTGCFFNNGHFRVCWLLESFLKTKRFWKVDIKYLHTITLKNRQLLLLKIIDFLDYYSF